MRVLSTRVLRPMLATAGVVVCATFIWTFTAFGQSAHGAAPPAAAAADPTFPVLEFRIEGNTVLPSLEIERAVYPHLGESRTIKDVERAREALEKAYHGAGYLTILVDIPEQNVEAGVVTLKVTEGRVDRLRVTGSRFYSLGRIRAAAPEVAEGNVPYFPQVQREIAGLNRSPDRKVTPVLRPSRTPGAVDVELKVEDRLPLHGGVDLTNRYSANTSALRLGGNLRYDNLWQRGHALTLTFLTAPRDTSEVQVFSASYLLPVPGSESLLSFYAVRSKSDVAAVGALNVLGDATIYGARLILPLAPGEGFYHSLVLGLDRRDIGETTNLQGGGGFSNPITYTPLVAQYSATLQGDKALTQLGASVSLGLRGLLGNDDLSFANRRFRASAGFLAARFDAQHTRALGNWLVFGRLEGQFASEPLINNEQFAAGGAESVRGYLEAERLGDHALRTSLELRSPPLAGEGGLLGDARLHAFVDAVELRIVNPLPETAARHTLASLGIGLRMRPRKGLALDFDLANPLRDAAFTRRGDARIHFRMAYEF